MLHVANAANTEDHLQFETSGSMRVFQMAIIAARRSVLVAISALALSSQAFAVPGLRLNLTSGTQIIPVGQQQSGQPVMIRGVFEGFDPGTHRLRLGHLDEIDFSWADTMLSVNVDDSVNMSAVEPGMTVIATVTRRPNGKYYVSKLERG